MKWHDIKDCTPREEIAGNTLYYDVWVNGWRVVDVKFKGGAFFEQITDHDGDYSHDEVVDGVTHWLEVLPPSA